MSFISVSHLFRRPAVPSQAPSETPAPEAVSPPRAAPASAKRPASLDSLPAELQCMVLQALTETDDKARLGATSRRWRALTMPEIHPTPLSPWQAVKSGHRHALGRALQQSNVLFEAFVAERDDDDMTPLMHAAVRDDVPMARCLIRHTSGRFDEVDRSGNRAVDWALAAASLSMGTMLKAVSVPPWSGNVYAGDVTSLHQAIAWGHRQLIDALLSPHAEANQTPWHITRPSVTSQTRLSCNQTPLVCAILHAPKDRLLAPFIQARVQHDALSAQQLAEVTTHLDPKRRDWAETLAYLLPQGFDVFAVNITGRSYFERWAQSQPLTRSKVAAWRTLIDDAHLPTLGSRALLLNVLGQRAHNRDPMQTLLLAFALAQGLRPFDDIDASAHHIAGAYGLTDALWAGLEMQGARLDARDAAGRTLAHKCREAPSVFARVETLMYLFEQGLDINSVCDAGNNPVIDLIMDHPQVHNILGKLHARNIPLDRPGRVKRYGVPFEAATAFEAVLFKESTDDASWFVRNDVACTLQQMQHAKRNLDATGENWCAGWFRTKLWARYLGMRGIYMAHVNPAGAWHAQLSRGRLAQAKMCLDAQSIDAQHSPQAQFWHTVRSSALTGAMQARRVAVPLTRACDGLLGTQRSYDEEAIAWPLMRQIELDSRPMEEWRASGLVGNGVAVVGIGALIAVWTVTNLAFAPVIMAFEVRHGRQCLRDLPHSLTTPGTALVVLAEYAIDRPVLWPLVQVSAMVGCVPKALVTAAGLAAGGTLGVIEGTANAVAAIAAGYGPAATQPPQTRSHLRTARARPCA